MDISKKRGLEYRLLHAVTRGRTWYGDWGYRFGAGSFALTAESYQKAIDTLAHLPLSPLFSHSRSPRTHLQDVITFYRSLSDCQLVTVRDLFSFVMQLLREAHKPTTQPDPSPCKRPPQSSSTGVLCAWTREDIEVLENALVKVLRAVGGSRWVPWRALRGAICQMAKSPVFVDYCLKRLGGRVTGDGMIVAIRCNAETNALEYRLEAVTDQHLTLPSPCSTPTEDHLLRDLKYLYDALLNPETMHQYRPQATRGLARESSLKLLDCKQFVKDYQEHLPPSSNPFALHVLCLVELVDQPEDYTAPPPELLVLQITATVAELKVEAARALQEAYLIFQRFHAEQLLDHNSVTDSTLVKHVVGPGGTLKIRGRSHGDYHRLGQFLMERGPENWTVDCPCGARDDDGERMLACDACGVWQHTRCCGIKDSQDVPLKFICRKCEGIRKLKSTGRGGRRKDVTRNGRCKDVVRCKIEKSCSAVSTITEDDGYGCVTQVW